MKSIKKVNVFSLFMIFTGILLIANVLLLDLTGRTFFVDKNFKDTVGVSITSKTSYPERGKIYDSEGNLLATNVTVYKLYFILNQEHQIYQKDESGNTQLVDDFVKDKKYTASVISSIVDGDESYIYERLCDQDAYQVEIGIYGMNISYDEKLEIESYNLPGVHFTSSISRYYPYGSFCSHLLGYTQKVLDEDGISHIVGVTGLESILNEQLSGTEGYEKYYTDVDGNILSGGVIEKQDGVAGYNVHTTLNEVIQSALEDCLEKTMSLDTDVSKSWGIVMNAKDGKILGYASNPDYDNNELDITNYNDYNAQIPYEPGSVMKTITYSIAVDLGNFDRNEMIDCTNFYFDPYSYKTIRRVDHLMESNQVIVNHRKKQYPLVSFYEAYINSYNVGCAILLEEQIDVDTYIDYMDKFLFTKRVGVYGIDEGDFYGSKDYSSNLSIISTSFGQAISVSALQIMRAYSCFANEGVMIQPRIIDYIEDPSTGEIIYQSQREELGQVIKAETAAYMNDMMYGVVEDVYYQLKVDNIKVGGKSGTAEVAVNGEYTNRSLHSFILQMPADDPQVLIYVAYEDDYGTAALNRNYLNELERKVASVLNLLDNDIETNKQIINLLDYRNHDKEYVRSSCDELRLKLIEIGDGDVVKKQYPLVGYKTISGSRLFIYTSGQITMIDMTGFSRSEVMAFWEMTGIATKINGYGYVTSQNIEPGTIIDKTCTIEVTLN